MFNYDKDALIELGKSFMRFIWFGFLGVVITALTDIATSEALMEATVTLGGVMFSVGSLLITGIGFLVKAIDRYIHKSKTTSLNGIAPSFLQR